MRLSVKLEAHELRLLGRLARKLKMSRPDFLRAGLEVLAARDLTTFERVSHLVGCVLSERTGSTFRRHLLLP